MGMGVGPGSGHSSEGRIWQVQVARMLSMHPLLIFSSPFYTCWKA